MRRSLSSRQDRGATLLSVLLIIVLMSTAALAATDALARSVGVSRTSAARAQGFWVARGAASAGEVVVNQLMAPLKGQLTDGMDVLEAPATFAYDHGAISIKLRDATNCFNLNLLAEINAEGGESPSSPTRKYASLLEGAGLFASDARQLSDALADWIDDDSSPRPYGAEESLYRARGIPHRPGSAPLVSVNDLRAVEGYTPDILSRIRHLVCVRNIEDNVPLNINTLTVEQAPLLAVRFSDEMTARDAERIILSRPEGGWLNVAEFFELPEVARIAPAVRSDSAISTLSSYLEADVMVTSVNGDTHLLALYGRDAEGKFVLRNAQRMSR